MKKKFGEFSSKNEMQKCFLNVNQQAKQERKSLTPSRRNEIAWRQQWKCVGECQQLLPPTWCMDHIVPLRNGGTNELSNFQALCANCHALKTLKETQHAHELKSQIRVIKSSYVKNVCSSSSVVENEAEKAKKVEKNVVKPLMVVNPGQVEIHLINPKSEIKKNTKKVEVASCSTKRTEHVKQWLETFRFQQSS